MYMKQKKNNKKEITIVLNSQATENKRRQFSSTFQVISEYFFKISKILHFYYLKGGNKCGRTF